MMKRITMLLFIACMSCSALAQQTSKAVMDGFMDKRFGMFIHWGPVALRGEEIGWSRDKQISKADYDQLYKEFNPVLFNADEWVKAAKDAGMKYLTITARHHDGFCLWPSAYTEYDITATPYKKDIVGALAKACKKAGIKFCIYYSVLDWYHPEYPIHSAHDQTPDPGSDISKYIVFMKAQLKELLTNYDPYMLWFDGGWEKPWTNEMGKDMYAYLKSIKPDVIINNRLGKEIAAVENKKIDAAAMIGDYDTPEQVVGRMNMNMPWESCFTICRQWAWKPNDKMKSLKECLFILEKTAGGNGNLLFNVGPMPDGRIEARQITRLKEMGDWLQKNGTAIYSTWGGPFSPTDQYAATRRGNKVFIHILKTETTQLSLPVIEGRKINKAFVLGTQQPVTYSQQEGKINLTLTPAPLNYVIVLEMDGDVMKAPVI
ncbi:alpha-L-fucosidase [Chitinophaga niabensis]|uniref:alpha-L-fucosidase n=1 Tax=Chitinophaga niabensis TaxID=536979 RepID=UPI0031BB3401